MTQTQTEAPPASVGLSVLVPEPLRDAVVEMAETEQRSIGSATRILLAERSRRERPRTADDVRI